MKLFISYRRVNWSFTSWLAEEIGKLLDADIFVDYSGIDDTDYESSLLRNLRESDAMILVVAEQTFEVKIHNDRDWVRREIREALGANIPIALAMVDGRVPPNELPDDIQEIRSKQGIEFYQRYFKAGVQELASLIDRATPIKLRQAVVTEPAKPTGIESDKAMFQRAIALCEAGQYDEAIGLFDTLMDKKYKSYISVEHLREKAVQDRDQETRRWEAGEAYDQLASAFRIMPARVVTAYTEFKTTYPEFTDDPAGLAEKIAAWQAQQKPKSKPKSKPRPKPQQPKPTPQSSPESEQERLLAIMLDPKRPPPERAAAAREINKYGDPRPGVCNFDFRIGDYWCEVPAGSYPLGSKQDSDNPPRKVKLPKFYIAKYPVTFGQFQEFIDDWRNDYSNPAWWKGLHADAQLQREKGPGEQEWKLDNHPRENVSWYEAMAYCRWLSARLHYTVTLPTEDQWEAAARGTDGREYPWGNGYKEGFANIDEVSSKVGTNYLEQTTAVGVYTWGASKCGALDLSGNVSDWMLTEYLNPISKLVSNKSTRSIRGGSWYSDSDEASAVHRFRYFPYLRYRFYGFRVVCLAPV